MPVAPYVVGQWVRGERFYGRRRILDEVLRGNRNGLWLLGTRRMGKTSILKQLELEASTAHDLGYLPLFWDMQGCDEPADLDDGLEEALLDAAERLEALGIDRDKVVGGDLFETLSRLRRELHTRRLSLLLLCDEVEELLGINEKDPRFLRRLRHALQAAENVRTVLASNMKLWDLSRQVTSTSPFLHGFTPPLFVAGLCRDEALALIHQTQLPEASRPGVDAATAERIRECCGHHPYLLQLLCERFTTLGDLDRAIEGIAHDEMVTHFFAVDYAMLRETDRDVVRAIGCGELKDDALRARVAHDSSSIAGSLQRLGDLGLVGRSSGNGYTLASHFLRVWWERRSESEAPDDRQVATRPDVTAGPGLHRRIDGRYDLYELLGRGGVGEVYKARDTLLQAEVAIKLLKATLANDEEFLERLRREVLLSRELGHPHIVRTYHLGEADGVMYVTMEYVEGRDLARALREGPLPVSQAVTIARKLSDALAFAHGRKVLHRDLKPSNILMDLRGEPRIGDFGLARLLDSPGITREGTFLGTPAYASPEQIRADPLDPRSDLYALGVVLFEMVTGRRPFAGDSVSAILERHLKEPPPSPSAIRPEIPRPLSDAILRCLAKHPGERFQSAEELLQALEQLHAGP